ncbi:hypothetical protein ACOZ4L_03000 [Haloplanus ruber]|uniref:Uncharacterized protein n=1 Tax=Haloplanus ruber TaxID=869892 RepID=A0ABD6CZV0_9EURY|nr:hypothetical protein [Haloplanus ruber]
MASNDSPYVFRGSPEDGAERPPTTNGQEVVIVDGRAMSYRWYRR